MRVGVEEEKEREMGSEGRDERSAEPCEVAESSEGNGSHKVAAPRTESEAWPQKYRKSIKTSSKTHDLCRKFVREKLKQMSVEEFVRDHITMKGLK